MAFENDSEAIDAFFSIAGKDRNEKIISLSKKWKTDNQSFVGFWGNIKKYLLSKPEIEDSRLLYHLVILISQLAFYQKCILQITVLYAHFFVLHYFLFWSKLTIH